jgi:hypothetical protein
LTIKHRNLMIIYFFVFSHLWWSTTSKITWILDFKILFSMKLHQLKKKGWLQLKMTNKLLSYEMITTMLRRQHHGRFFVWKDSVLWKLMIICVLCWKHHHIIDRNFFLNSWKWIFSWPYSSHAMVQEQNNCVNWALWESVVDNKSI